MGCPHLENMLKGAVSGCPFLRDLAERHGSSYAEQIAVQPARPAVRGSTPVLEEGVEGFQATLALFHGAAGVVPLARFQQATGPGPEAPGQASRSDRPCAHSRSCHQTEDSHLSSRRQGRQQSAPFAAISISLMKGLPGYRDVFKRRRKHDRAGQGQQPVHSQGLNHAASRFWLQGAAVLGSLVPPAKHGHLGCPPAIIALRVAVAAVPGVKELRPKALPTKLIAVGLAVGMLNMPFGGLREHVDKFSPEWFLAVHATIPFVAALRKAVLMPRWAVALTIASAVAGQITGSRMERQRIRGPVQPVSESSSESARQRHSPVSVGLSLSTSSGQPSVQFQAGDRAPAGLQSCGVGTAGSQVLGSMQQLAAVR